MPYHTELPSAPRKHYKPTEHPARLVFCGRLQHHAAPTQCQRTFLALGRSPISHITIGVTTMTYVEMPDPTAHTLSYVFHVFINMQREAIDENIQTTRAKHDFKA